MRISKPLLVSAKTLTVRFIAAMVVFLFTFIANCFAQSLSKADIVQCLKRSVPSFLIERQISKLGINFVVDEDLAGEFRKLGASNSLLTTLRQVSRAKALEAVPTASATPGNSQTSPPAQTGGGKTGDPPATSVANPETLSPQPRPPSVHRRAPKGTENVDWWEQLEIKLSYDKLNGQMLGGGDGSQLYGAKFWLVGPKSILDRIKRVDYYFDHESYRPKTKVGSNVSNGFMISYKAFGCIEDVRVTIIPAEENVQGATTDFKFCDELQKIFQN